jgi:hypothetical protein
MAGRAVKKNGSLTRPAVDQDAYVHLQSIYERVHNRLEFQGRDGSRGQDKGA